MRSFTLISGLIVAATFASIANAETLRCGSSLISEGATSGAVVEKCGKPDAIETFTEPVIARRIDGTTFEAGTTTREVWRYKRGQGKFPAVLTFEMGVLKKLEFEK